MAAGLSASQAAVLSAVPGNSDPALRAVAGVQVAQAYDFDVYIDEQGREVIVDPRTGRVVEVRQPLWGGEPPRRGGYDRDPYERPTYDEPVYNRDTRDYNLSDPRDIERLRRDREAAIFGNQGAEPPYEDLRRPDYNNGWDDRSYPDGGQFRGERGEDRTVTRMPIDPPVTGEHDQRSENRSAAIEPREPDLAPIAPHQPGLSPSVTTPRPDITISGSLRAREELAAVQILLDRRGASPGVVDGRMGDNVNKAISSYQEITGHRMPTYDKEWINAELEKTGGPAFIDYTITSEDAAGPYVAAIPADYSEKAKLDRMSFTRVTEMLAERFHMDEKFLQELNPGANFDRPGTILRVANTNMKLKYDVGRIVADKAQKQVRIYDTSNRLVAAYPATIGSESTPSPSGTHTVQRVALNPEYTYNPKINFQQGNNTKVLTIPPGPNGPVGSVWIGLSKPTYGIHGTPEPGKIGKTYSNGCVRLTNWDAEELAARVKAGVTVEFL